MSAFGTLLIAAAIVACLSAHPSLGWVSTQQVSNDRWVYVPAGASLRAKCRETARSLGYPIPCLREVPPQMSRQERLEFIGRGRDSWRRWAVGSTYVGSDHLVATASPRPLTNDARVVNGPAWYPKARVTPVAWFSFNGWRMRAVYVPPATNDGSAFMHHVVLIWSVGHHTYGFGFHDLQGIRHTLRLDEHLARYVTLVRP